MVVKEAALASSQPSAFFLYGRTIPSRVKAWLSYDRDERQEKERKQMIQIQPLSWCTWEESLALWNEAFSDYFVDVSMTMEAFVGKWSRESLSPDHSLVAVADGKLVGLVCSGIRIVNGKKMAWNGGTAVVPAWRGKGVGRKLMEETLALYEREGVELATLEAIATNQAAIRLYERLGYRIVDRLSYYQSTEPLRLIEAEPSVYRIERVVPAQVATLPFYSAEMPWQGQWFCLRDGEAWVVADGRGGVLGYALDRREFDERGRLCKTVLYQVEIAPGRIDEQACFLSLLEAAWGPATDTCERIVANWPSAKRMGVEIFNRMGMRTAIEQVWMMKEIGAKKQSVAGGNF
jgi:ribosomal protein S18 acetylase RimI-like enzyme